MEFPDTTLNAALTDHITTRFVELSGLSRDELDEKTRSKDPAYNLPRRLLQSLRTTTKNRNIELFEKHTAYHTPTLMSMVPDKSVDPNQATKTLLDCTNFVNILKIALKKSLTTKLHQDCEKSFSNRTLLKLTNEPSEELVHIYCQVAMWQRFVDTATNKFSGGVSWSELPCAFVNKNMTIITVDGLQIVLPHDALLMLKDMIWGKFLCCVYSHIDQRRSNLYHLVEFVWKWGMLALKRYGDYGYNLIKMIEPLCTARLIQMSETILDPDYQLNNMVVKYREKEQEIQKLLSKFEHSTPTFLSDIFVEFLKNESNPENISEIFSLNRLVGHPYVDPIAGSEALKKLAQAPSTATYSGIKAVGWSFCHMFTKGYIDKKHEWPPMEFNLPPGRNSLLKELHDKQHAPLPLGLSIYDPSDWDYVTFLPVDEFDYGEDILSLMTDKSLSYKRSEVDCSWKGRLSYTPGKATSSNRVLHELLSRSLNMREVCEFFRTGNLPYDWLVVVIHPKEREPKMPVPRMFAIMDIHPRSFFCLLEKNLAEKLFPYIPEQTMTMSQQEEEESFISITRQSSLSKTLSIGLDLSKWCSHFKKKTVSMVGDRLNQLLGVENLYGSVHDFFEKCLIVLRHHSFTPKQDTKNKRGNLVDEPGIYSGSEAGIEGIQQKLWTLVTLCMLHWAVWRFGCSYKITCQGDNLVIHILVTRLPGESDGQFQNRIRQLNEKVLSSIERAASMIGHEVNPDECFSSTSFTTYGKNMWFQGRKLPTVLKVASRMFPKTTSDTPSTESIIANIAATGTSMVERSSDVLVSFLFSKFVEYLVVGREFKMSLVHKDKLMLDPNSFVFSWKETGGPILCCLIPANLGGFPISCLAEYLYRGHSDPLSSSLGSVAMFMDIPIVRKYLSYLSTTLLVRDLRDRSVSDADVWRQRETLIRDPYSVPLRMTPGSPVKTTEYISEALVKITNNEELRPIVKLSTDKKEEGKLIKMLLSSKPLNPKVLHEIHKCSVFGVAAAMSRRFTDTRTIRRITCKGDVDIVSAHISNDLSLIRAIMSNFKSVIEAPRPPPETLFEPYKLMVQMREKWGLGILDGVTNYHPLMAGSWIPTNNINPIRLSEIIMDESNPLIVCMSLSSSISDCLSTRGKVQPFLGSQTSEKAISKWVQPIDSSPPLKDALRLIQIAKLCTSEGTNLRKLIEDLAIERTCLPIPLLYEMARESIGGTVSHRLNTSVATQGSRIASLPNWSTHMSISSNLSREMGANDYPVSFAEYYLTSLCVSKWFYEDLDLEAPFGLLHLVDLSPLQPVQDMSIEISDRQLLRHTTLPSRSYYLFAESVHLSSRNKTGLPLPMSEMRVGEPTASEGITQLLLQSITSNKRVVRKFGYDRSQLEKRLQIDLPEAGLITKTEYLNSAAWSIVLYSARNVISRVNKKTTLENTMTSVFLQSALRLSPSMLATISLSSDNDDDMLRLSTGSWSVERSIIRLSCLLVTSAIREIKNNERTIPIIFEKTTSSMSSLMASRIFTKILGILIDDPKMVLSCKYLLRLTGNVLSRPDESMRVAGLASLVTAMNWGKDLRTTDSAAESIVRTLRVRVKGTSGVAKKFRYHLGPTPDRSNVSTCFKLKIPAPSKFMTPEYLIESWSKRPFPGRSDSWMKWSPIYNQIPQGSIVYIIGIGAGGVISCVPRTCKVYGVDLPKAVENLGQSFVNYQSTVYHPDYSTRPITWLYDLSRLDSNSQQILKHDIKLVAPDLVIIDVDEIGPNERLSLRYQIASELCPCWVRVHSTKGGVEDVVRSIDSIRSDSDNWWTPGISCGLEVILGSSPRPLGMYGVVEGGSVPDREVTIKTCEPSWDELVEFVLHFGGGVVDTTTVDLFIRKHKVKLFGTPLAMYNRCVLDPGGAMLDYGRQGCRYLVSVVPWFL